MKTTACYPFSSVAAMLRMTWSGTKKHEKERKATIQECKKDADELQKPDCKTRAKPIVSCLFR